MAKDKVETPSGATAGAGAGAGTGAGTGSQSWAPSGAQLAGQTGSEAAAERGAIADMPVVVTTDKAPRSSGPVSQAVIAHGFAFISGQLPIDPTTRQIQTGFAAQARQVLDNVKAVVEAAGSSMERVVRTTVYVTDIRNKGLFNEIYKEYFSKANP